MVQVDLTKVPPHTPPPQRRDARDDDPNPTYLEVETYGHVQRYPIEVWRVSNGDTYAIVTDVKNNKSLANAQERVIEAIQSRWGALTRVIEYWPEGFIDRHYRQVHSQSGGGGLAPNYQELDACGLYLKPPR